MLSSAKPWHIEFGGRSGSFAAIAAGGGGRGGGGGNIISWLAYSLIIAVC